MVQFKGPCKVRNETKHSETKRNKNETKYVN